MVTSFAPSTRAADILKRLKKAYPVAACGLNFTTSLELLVATILSAQCTDARVNEVTPALFKKYRTAKAYAQASTAELEAMIRSTGFYRNKAKSIQNCCAQITMQHGGDVPRGMGDLTALAGVGRKTANLVRAYAFSEPGIICDTHVIRVSGRLGLTEQKDANKIEIDLMKIVPEKNWTNFSTLLMWHGRKCCVARKPDCAACPLRDVCPYPSSL
jgi:endonuclease-3